MKRLLSLTAILLVLCTVLSSCVINQAPDNAKNPYEEQYRDIYSSYANERVANGLEPDPYESWIGKFEGANAAAPKKPYIGQNWNWWIGDDDTGVVANNTAGKQVYWDRTDLIFEMSEHSQYGELVSGVRKYYAGETVGEKDKVDKEVIKRNNNASNFANVNIEYRYLSGTNHDYAWASNLQRIFEQTKTHGPDSPDIYCNFAYDISCAALKGCFANLKSTSYGRGNNFYRFNDNNYKANSKSYFDTNSGEGYFYEHMKSITLSDDKLYCLASNYTTDFIRAFLVVPVNVSLLNSIERDQLISPTVPFKEGQTNLEYFYDLIYSGEWNYNTIAKLSQAVYRDINNQHNTEDRKSTFGDVLGFALSASSGKMVSGLLYSSTVEIIEREAIIGQPGMYKFYYPEKNNDLVEFADALASLVTDNASNGISVITKDETGAYTEVQGIRNEFVSDRILFGGIFCLGSLEDEVFQQLRSKEGLGIAPVPMYKSGDASDYNTHSDNVGRTVAVAKLTDKFEQCSAFLDYQSRNSSSVLDLYYKSLLTVNKDSDAVDHNSEMLTFIRNHAIDGFDKIMEDIIGDRESPPAATYVPRRWHEHIRHRGYIATDMAEVYDMKYKGKQGDLDNIRRQWNRLSDPLSEDNIQ